MTQIVDINNTPIGTSDFLNTLEGNLGFTGAQTTNQFFKTSSYGNITHAGNGYGLSLAPTTNTLYYFPFYCPHDMSVASISVRSGITASAPINVNMGIYENKQGVPIGDPIANTTTGTITLSATSTVYSYTYGAPPSLSGGKFYWVAIVANGNTVTFTGLTAATNYTATNAGLGCPAASIAGSTRALCGYTQSFTYGTTLPTVGSLTNIIGVTTGIFGLMWLKAV